MLARLLHLSLVLPVLLALYRIAGFPMPPPELLLIRVDKWAVALRQANPLVMATLVTVLAGVFAIFVFQELLPLRKLLKKRLLEAEPDSRLSRTLQRVRDLYLASRLANRSSSRPLPGLRLPSPVPLAALHGLRHPVLVVSQGLLQRLNEEELEGVVAHEVAHLHFGGNLQTLLVWIARAVQALNPASLILFRELIDTREFACDALAVRVTAKPQVLAGALLKFGDTPPAEEMESNSSDSAAHELQRRDEADSAQSRYYALRDTVPGNAPPEPLGWILALALGGLLCLIG